ncbi:MAG: bacillithiol biosynthesis cysteine-adding enzyme BshC [Bacteroidetes bacterium]|nr:bacillithiol biosynthesis cysteine-adding enzyme BshC [Bacteroidota bacterium]
MTLLSSFDFKNSNFLPAFISDYLSNKESLSHLSKYPFKFSSFKNVIADKAKDNTDRKLLVEVLQSQYSNISTADSVSKNIESLLSENTFTVVAAHQPCLFMGPLYNIYKIACAIQTTQQLKKEYPNQNFVPVFWLGTEDHDVQELNHVFVNGKKIEWNNPGTGTSGRWHISSMQTAVDELKSISANAEIISILEEGLRKYETFGKFTQYFVNEIFKEHGLVVLDGDNVLLKKKFSAVIKEEVLHSKAVDVLKENVAFLETNYKAQAKPREINFFYLGENYRERIVYNSISQKFEVNNTSVSFSRDEIVSEIENHPARFSPNVIYRPLYQEMILPNLAFVGGAGELSYWLELKPLFDYYKVNYPMQVMRNSAAIINASVHKKLEKLNLKAEDFFEDLEQLINSYVKQNMNADSNLAGEKKKLEELFDSILKKAEASDVTLKQSATGEKQKVITALENLEAKMLKAEKRKQETAVNQIRSIHATLFPDGVLQERRENFIPYYTNDFISEIISNSNSFNKSFLFYLNHKV